MKIYKDRLPSGESYALKPSLLEAALAAAGIATKASLFQRRSGWLEGGALFEAEFYPPGRNYRNQEEEISIRTRAVPSSFRREARAFMEERILPEFIAWILEIERLPTDSTVRREKQSLVRTWLPRMDDQGAA